MDIEINFADVSRGGSSGGRGGRGGGRGGRGERRERPPRPEGDAPPPAAASEKRGGGERERGEKRGGGGRGGPGPRVSHSGHLRFLISNGLNKIFWFFLLALNPRCTSFAVKRCYWKDVQIYIQGN